MTADLSRTPRREIESHQVARLRDLLARVSASNGLQAARLRQSGLTARETRLDDFCRLMPFTTKAELVADQRDHPPYGSSVLAPVDRFTRLHQTSATTGEPLRWIDTPESWNAMVDDWCEVLEAAGVRPGDRLLAAFSFGPFIGFWLAFEAAARLGCLCISGGAMNSATRLRAILANRVTVICCTPTYAIRLGEEARDESIDLQSLSPVRVIVVAGEPGGSIPAVRSRIESLWRGARVFDHHGMTETGPISYECPARPGSLHLIESSFLCEFIDPGTGDPVAPDAARTAELVVTTLRRNDSPVFRYRTGDVVRPAPDGICACGRTFRILEGGVIGRLDDMVFVRGVNLYPGAVEQVMRSCAGLDEYRVDVSEQRGMVEVQVTIEAAADASAERVAAMCEAALRDAFNLRIPVRSAARGTLARSEMKSRRWVKVSDGGAA
jgi:phenylacetate-CoA ligase